MNRLFPSFGLSVRSFFIALLVMIISGISIKASATVKNDATGCYYVIDGHYYINTSINRDAYNSFMNIVLPGHTVRITGSVYNAAGTLLTPSPLIGISYGSNVIFDMGTISPAYQIIVTMVELDASGNVFRQSIVTGLSSPGTITSSTVVDVNCGPPLEPDGDMKATACFHFIGKLSRVQVNVDALYLLYSAYFNYSPVLEIRDPANPAIFYGPFYPLNISGNTIYYYVNNPYLDENICYEMYEYLLDQNGNPISYNYAIPQACVCKPEDKDCSARFNAYTADLGYNTFQLNAYMVSVTANMTNEFWTVTDASGAVVYTNSGFTGGMTVNLPYGTYRIDHKVNTRNGSCENSQFVSFGVEGGISSGPAMKPANLPMANAAPLTAFHQNGQTRINYNAVEKGAVNYTIYNNLGQRIAAKSNVEVQQGTNTFTETNTLVPGIYYVRITGSSTDATTRFVVE